MPHSQSHLCSQSFRFGPSRFRHAIESCLAGVQTWNNSSKPLTTLSQPVMRKAPVTTHAPGPLRTPDTKVIPIPATPASAPVPIPTPSQDVAPQPTPPPPDLLPSGQRRLSLLLVEDNPINLKLLIASFKKMGHSYVTATNGAIAVDAYKSAPLPQSYPKFDMIFMDIQMPVMNGMEASIEIRKYEKEMSLKPSLIIALTALTSLQAEQEALDAGADQFMNKPVSIKKLREVVEEHFPF